MSRGRYWHGLCALVLAGVFVLSGASTGAAAQLRSRVIVGFGDRAGYHLSVGQLLGGVGGGKTLRWRDLAVLDPEAVQDRSWTGSQCMTGDGRYAAVVVLPSSAANSPSQLAHGGYAYAVDLDSGQVRLIATHVRVGYDTPGCGLAHSAVLTAFDGPDERATTLTIADLAGGSTRTLRIRGELTSPIPAGGGVIAARGAQLVRVSQVHAQGHVHVAVLRDVPGVPYDLRPLGTGAIDYLVTVPGSQRATLWQRSGGRSRELGFGPRVGTALLQAGNRAVVTGLRTLARSPDLIRAGSPAGWVVGAASQDGRLLAPLAVGRGSPTSISSRTTSGRRVSEAWSTYRARRWVAPFVSSTGGPRARAAAQQPVCAVPRLDPTRQALQPSAAQVNWASQMAERGLLTGSLGRPAGFDNMGLPGYSASGDFPPIPLDHPGGDSWNAVPRSVFDAIMAQESNWDQASFHALPGIAGDPLVADYYGNGANSIETIDYGKADCGYGIAQVTDGMQARDTLFSPAEQVRIAVDYEENIAAGLRILEQTWNDLYQDGILANGGDPRYLENWYFAAWAYNTGIEPNAAHGNTTGCTPGPGCTGPDGTWGLGWANNPANPAYPPNRAPFLESTYADAAHPADWPYQERIIGWMGSPLLEFGSPSYAGPDYNGSNWLNLPANNTFCSGVNHCSGAGLGTSGNCALGDSECWWHGSANWANCSVKCATSGYSVSAGSGEPGVRDPHPPTCASDLPTSSHGPPIIVDDQNGGPVDLVGCGRSNWTDAGTFTYTYGHGPGGDPIGAIDTHQLGAGFGGHILFTHTENGSNPALINTGTWTPSLPKAQYYDIRVHVPATGAAITDATYVISSGGYGGPWSVTVNQAQSREAWLDLGHFGLGPRATVTLTNRSGMTPGENDVAYDAVAFMPEGGTPDPVAPPPPSAAAGCTAEAKFGPIDAVTSCFTKSHGKYVSRGEVRIGGIDVVPGAGASISLDPATYTLALSGSVEISVGSLHLAAERDYSVSLKRSWTFASSADATIKGLPVSGDATITFSGSSAHAEINVGIKALGSVTGKAELDASNSTGLQLRSLQFNVKQAQLGSVELKSIHLAYDRTDAGDRWKGSATVVLPFPEVRSISGSATILNGTFQNASASANTNLPVADGVFLTQIRANLTLNPSLVFGGGITLSAGPAIRGVGAASLTGNFAYRSAVGSTPAEFDLTGALKLANRLDLSNGSLTLTSLGAVSFSGDLDLTLAGAGFKGSVAGSIDGTQSMQASSEGKLEVGGHHLDGQAILSTKGVGVCGELNLIVHVSVGFGFLWSQFPTPDVRLKGCDISTWAAAATSASASTTRSAQVPRGLSFIAFRATGPGTDAPAITATEPHGQHIAPQGDFADEPTRFYFRDLTHGTTYLIVPRPSAGRWTISSSDGVTPIVGLATADPLPTPLVTGHVTGTGADRLLRYRIKRQAGQSVEFYDVTGTGLAFLRRTRAERGTVRFRPLLGSSAVHHVIAVVLQDGLPRRRLRVTSFSARRLATPGRVTHITIVRRRGALRIKWARARNASGYVLKVALRDGRVIALSEKTSLRVVTIPNVPRQDTVDVSILAIGLGGLASPAAHARR